MSIIIIIFSQNILIHLQKKNILLTKVLIIENLKKTYQLKKFLLLKFDFTFVKLSKKIVNIKIIKL
jgi:hypothetical protein